jgi:hypothetical protein
MPGLAAIAMPAICGIDPFLSSTDHDRLEPISKLFPGVDPL